MAVAHEDGVIVRDHHIGWRVERILAVIVAGDAVLAERHQELPVRLNFLTV